MKTGFCTKVYPDVPLAELLAQLAETGYGGAQIDPSHAHAGLSTEERQAVAATLQASRLEQFVLTAPVLLPPYPPEQRLTRDNYPNYVRRITEEVETFQRVIDLAVDLGITIVKFYPSGFYYYTLYPDEALPTHPARVWNPDEIAWRFFTDAVCAVAGYAERRGIIIAAEDHAGCILDTPEKQALLLELVGSPALKVLFDASHYHVLNVDLPAAVRLLGPAIVHTHIKGVRGQFPRYEFFVPGEAGDEFDFDAFVLALAAVGYQGMVCAETFPWLRSEQMAMAQQFMVSRLAALGLADRP